MRHRISKKEATISTVLRGGHENSAGELPVRIAVIYNREARYYPVKTPDGRPLYLPLKDKAALTEFLTTKVRGDSKRLQEEIETTKSKAVMARDTITQGEQPFTFEKFEQEFLQQESKKGFLQIFRDHLEQLKKEGRIGTYNSYKNAYSAFNKFRGAKYDKSGKELAAGKELSPVDVTPALLKDFEVSVKKGARRTTVAIYMRSIKVIYNIAADKNPTLLETYPFARKQTDRSRYKIRTGAGHKGEPLSIDQIKKFIALKTTDGLPDHEAKLLWLFSFYCQGMNMKDIFLLKYRDIQGDTIRFIRAKTKDTEDRETEMEIILTEPIREIIRTIGNPDKSQNSYVFTVIPNGLASNVKRRSQQEKTPEERIHEIIKQKTKMVNARVKQLCKDSEDNDLKALDLTTYWARHTFASLLKDAGESVEMIRELLGHSDIKTTESYLKRFDINKRQAVNEKIQSLLKVS